MTSPQNGIAIKSHRSRMQRIIGFTGSSAVDWIADVMASNRPEALVVGDMVTFNPNELKEDQCSHECYSLLLRGTCVKRPVLPFL